ncbi:hypothetical protein [Pseudomonas shirazica]|uniref:hypothetical protein n=1 Tax=Pseudomonas shirazica TaxID=1940636 RepID=UPI001C27727D|nr:hypothetical protein [Pseudomonas shirazica]
MAKQVINLGASPTGTGGDDRRSAWVKAKANFTELYNWIANLSQGDDVATALPAALPVAKGGTGATTQAAARTALQLGTAATLNVGLASGNVLQHGAFGLGSTAVPIAASMNVYPAGFYSIQDPDTQYAASTGVTSGSMICMGFPFQTTYGSQLWMGFNGKIGFRSGNYASAAFNTIYHTGNTTRAADGTLKAI